MDGYRRMLSDDNFSQKELSAIAYGYTRLLQESTHALQDLKEIINPTEMSMTDKGPPRRHRTGSCRAAALPEPHGLLYAQKHFGIPAALAQKRIIRNVS